MYKILFALVLLFVTGTTFGQQDVIIRDNYKLIDGTITGMDEQYLNIDKLGSPYTLPVSSLEVIILNDGYVISTSKIDSNFTLENFKAVNKNRVGENSHIIDNAGNIIQTKHFTIKLDEIAYFDARINQEASIPKSDVIVTIDKGGEIKLMKNADIVTFKLNTMTHFSYNTDGVVAEIPNDEVIPIEIPDEVVDPSLIESVENPEDPELDGGVDVRTDEVNVEYEKVIVENPFDETNFVEQDEYKRKSLEKVEDLGEYLAIISDKSMDSYKKAKATDEAIGLFTSEDATVEVSNVNTGNVKVHKIRAYLKALGMLNYDKIVIKWSDIGYVSKLRPDQEGNLWGTVSIKQQFTGYRDGMAIYSDITYKEVEVMLKKYGKTVDGEEVKQWDVLLNNIGVAVNKNELI